MSSNPSGHVLPFLIGLAVAAVFAVALAGALGYYLWRRWRRSRSGGAR